MCEGFDVTMGSDLRCSWFNCPEELPVVAAVSVTTDLGYAHASWRAMLPCR